MLFNSSSEEIEFPSFDPDYAKEKVVEQKQGVNKKCLVIIIVIAVLIVLIAGIVLAVYFGSKNKENGGNIKLYLVFNKSNTNFNVINNINLDTGDYLVKYNNNTPFRLLSENQKSFESGQCIYGPCYVTITFDKILTSIESMFSNIQQIKYADFSELNTKKIINMNNLFLNCKNLEYVNFNNFQADKLETMNSAFENCESLSKIDLEDLVTPRLKSMNSAFKGCSSLIQLNIKNFIINSKTNIDNIIEGCDHLMDFILPESNKELLKNEYDNINVDKNLCDAQNNIMCKVCENKILDNNENVKICRKCHDGYFLYKKADLPIKCNKCKVEHCIKCENEYTCNECEEDYNVDENNNNICSYNPSSIPDSTIPNIDTTSDQSFL
jgi:hypothetical protein